MKTKAVRLYGKNDLRLEEFELPQIKEDEILAKVVCDSICMSSYKASHEADIHKRVPRDIAQNPVIIGHEFAGEIVEVGAKWKEKFTPGAKFSIQPALNYGKGPVGVLSAPGYSYRYIGGDATYVVIPNEVMEQGCLLNYTGKGFTPGALLRTALVRVIGAMHANYHHARLRTCTRWRSPKAVAWPSWPAWDRWASPRSTTRSIKDRKPRLIVVTDIDQSRLDRAASLYSPEEAAKNGIELKYVNTGAMADPTAELKALTGGKGYNDVFVFAPVVPVVEQADAILAFDGCLNFFAGPAKTDFKAPFNFYNVHYAYTHVVGTSGGNTADMIEALEMMSAGPDPAGLVTHVGGLNAVDRHDAEPAQYSGREEIDIYSKCRRHRRGFREVG